MRSQRGGPPALARPSLRSMRSAVRSALLVSKLASIAGMLIRSYYRRRAEKSPDSYPPRPREHRRSRSLSAAVRGLPPVLPEAAAAGGRAALSGAAPAAGGNSRGFCAVGARPPGAPPTLPPLYSAVPWGNLGAPPTLR